MCGIIGYVGKNKNAIDVLLNGLSNLSYRGYDSSGIAYLYNNEIKINKEPGKINNLEKVLSKDIKSNIGIGHTRWATHGKANKINAHPHKCGKFTVVHNGIIENYIDLKKELEKIGYKFNSETDSEVAVALLDNIYSKTNDINEAIKIFQSKVRGSYALGIICDDNLDEIYAVRKNSPLIIGTGENENFIASDMPAIIDYTNKYITLNDGEIAKISNNNIVIYNSSLEIINKDIKISDNNRENISKNNFEHYMLKEIFEQPFVVNNTVDNIFDIINNMPSIKKYKNIQIVACGSAMHAGLVGKSLIEKFGKIKVNVEIASEFRYSDLFIDENTLVIAISQSGETADTLEAIKIAKEKGCDTLGIVNVYESSIARSTSKVLYTNAGSEIAVATTKAYSAQILMLSIMAYLIAKENNIKDNFNELKSFLVGLKDLPKSMYDVLDKRDDYKIIAKDLYDKENIFFIGRKIDYALCMEGSLKLKEISYIHSEAYPAGELKHGTISLIDNDTPIIAIATDKSILDKTISNIKEVKARGAYVIYITTKDLDIEGDFYDKKIVIPQVNELLTPLLCVIPLQLISYEIAKLRNCDIDKPRNLAKSVTVE